MVMNDLFIMNPSFLSYVNVTKVSWSMHDIWKENNSDVYSSSIDRPPCANDSERIEPAQLHGAEVPSDLLVECLHHWPHNDQLDLQCVHL